MDLQEFLNRVGGNESDIIVFASEEEALKAVERNSDALKRSRETAMLSSMSIKKFLA